MLNTGIKWIFKRHIYCPLSILMCKYDVGKDNRGLCTVWGKQEGMCELPEKIMENLSWFF